MAEQSPAKSPWTSDNTFIRSRFIVRRLKRMRSKTKSLSEDVDGLYRFSSHEPTSLPFEVNTENKFLCCSGENVDALVDDLVNISIKNQIRLKEEDVTFEDESVKSLSGKQSSSDCNFQRIEEIHEDNNNLGISTESLNKVSFGYLFRFHSFCF